MIDKTRIKSQEIYKAKGVKIVDITTELGKQGLDKGSLNKIKRRVVAKKEQMKEYSTI